MFQYLSDIDFSSPADLVGRLYGKACGRPAAQAAKEQGTRYLAPGLSLSYEVLEKPWFAGFFSYRGHLIVSSYMVPDQPRFGLFCLQNVGMS